MTGDAFGKTDRSRGEKKKEVISLFDLNRKHIISASVPPILMLLIGTTEKQGIIKYVDRSDIIAGGILKELRREFPTEFQEAIKRIEKHIKANPDDKGALRVWNETKRILEMS